MSVEDRLKKIEQKTQANEKKDVRLIILYRNKEGIAFEKDGRIFNDFLIINENEQIEGSSKEGRKILLEAGYKIIKRDSV